MFVSKTGSYLKAKHTVFFNR